jgi:hypothetical protein
LAAALVGLEKGLQVRKPVTDAAANFDVSRTRTVQATTIQPTSVEADHLRGFGFTQELLLLHFQVSRTQKSPLPAHGQGELLVGTKKPSTGLGLLFFKAQLA